MRTKTTGAAQGLRAELYFFQAYLRRAQQFCLVGFGLPYKVATGWEVHFPCQYDVLLCLYDRVPQGLGQRHPDTYSIKSGAETFGHPTVENPPQLIGTSCEGEGVEVGGDEGLLSREIVAMSGASSWKDPRLVSR